MRLSIIWALMAGFLLSSCAASTARLEFLEPGMSRADVISVLGNPKSETTYEGHDVMEYYLHYDANTLVLRKYWVILKDGKVINFDLAEKFDLSQKTDKKRVYYFNP